MLPSQKLQLLEMSKYEPTSTHPHTYALFVSLLCQSQFTELFLLLEANIDLIRDFGFPMGRINVSLIFVSHITLCVTSTRDNLFMERVKNTTAHTLCQAASLQWVASDLLYSWSHFSLTQTACCFQWCLSKVPRGTSCYREGLNLGCFTPCPSRFILVTFPTLFLTLPSSCIPTCSWQLGMPSWLARDGPT